MAKGPVYTQEQRQEAIDLALAESVDIAVQRLGVNKKTLQGWLSKAGLSKALDEKRQKAIEAAQTENELRWARIQEKMLAAMEDALDSRHRTYTYTHVTKSGEQIEVTTMPTPGDLAKIATEYGIYFDKRQLATGGPTANTTATVENPSLQGLLAKQNKTNAEIQAQVAEALAGEGT